MFKKCLTTYLIVFINIACAQQPFDKDRLIIQPFNYNEVKLNDGPLKIQLKEVENDYLSISNDDLLKGFRARAGLPAYGNDLGGWYSNDVFHVFGQLLSGFSRLYAVSKNEALRVKVNTLVTEWGKTIDSNGYFFYSGKPNAPHYVYEKMVGGLVDAYLFTGNKEALDKLSVITDWAIKNLSRERIYGQTRSEWYTLSENLYRAYKVTNDPKYRDFGKLWEYREYWDSYITGDNIPPIDKQRHHAYSHLNTLNGAAAAYMISGDEKYKSIIKNAYDFFQDQQVFATGGFGPNERLLSKDDLIKALQTTHHSFETQCGSWAIFKFSKYLLEITGDAKYGDWIEKMIVNGVGANVPMTIDGKVHYYSDYNPREGTKHNYHLGWSCCTGTRPQAVADYVNLIYFKDKSGLYINLYVPSEVKWNNLTVIQKTKYPESNQSEFTIKTPVAGSQKRALMFRVPAWVKGSPVVKINNVTVKPAVMGNWLKIESAWKNNDVVTLAFPMELYIDRLDENKEYPAAFMYGPVTMATNVVDQYPSDIVKLNLSTSFKPIEGRPLNFNIENHPDLKLRPYYQYLLNEPYMLYVDTAVRNYVPEKNLVFSGKWDKAKGPFFSNDPDASVSTSFEGSGIDVLLSGFRNAGKVSIEIDGKQMELIDTYHSENRELPIAKSYILSKGKHNVKAIVTGDKNQESNGTFANFVRFKVIE